MHRGTARSGPSLRRRRSRAREELLAQRRRQRADAQEDRVASEEPGETVPMEMWILRAAAAARLLGAIGAHRTAPVDSWGRRLCEHATKHATAAPCRRSEWPMFFSQLAITPCAATTSCRSRQHSHRPNPEGANQLTHFCWP